MRQTFQTMSFILLTGVMLAGCDYKFQPYTVSDILGDKKPDTGNPPYIDLEKGLLKHDYAVKDETTASDIAARLSEKYGQAVDELKDLQTRHMALVEKDKGSQMQISKLQSDITRAEKELTEANTMLLEMREELTKWKKDVLSFRAEMRQSQKAMIDGLTRLHVLISGGVAMDPPKTQSAAPIAANTKENSGENLQ